VVRFAVTHAARIAAAVMLHSCFETPIGFTLEALPLGGQVAIHYESRGCFHKDVADFVLTRVADGLTIQGRNVSANLARGWHMEIEQQLDMDELRRLDAMLTVHRQGGSGGCTTVERLRIRWPNAPVGHFTESFVGSGCVDMWRSNVRSFGSLQRVVKDSTRDSTSRAPKV
jgi:hypothetical protein